MKIKKECAYCGKEYEVQRCQAERSKYCSDQCARAAKRTKVKYCCDYCGKEFMVHFRKIQEKTDGKRTGIFCSRECAKDVQRPKYEEIDIAFKERGYILLDNEYVSAKNKMRYVCKKHVEYGIQEINWSNFRSGFGCKYCGRERTTEARKKSFEEAYNIFLENDMVLCEQEYIDARTPMSYICKHHVEKGIQYKSLTNATKQHCPYCSISKGEERITNLLIEKNIAFEPQKKFENLLGAKGGQLSYDFYLPDHNLLIEYQGEFHDGTASTQSEDEYAIQVEHDQRKRNYAISHGIDLLEIWYYEKENLEELIDSKIRSIA